MENQIHPGDLFKLLSLTDSFSKHTSASDRARAISGGTPPSRPIAMLLQMEKI